MKIANLLIIASVSVFASGCQLLWEPSIDADSELFNRQKNFDLTPEHLKAIPTLLEEDTESITFGEGSEIIETKNADGSVTRTMKLAAGSTSESVRSKQKGWPVAARESVFKASDEFAKVETNLSSSVNTQGSIVEVGRKSSVDSEALGKSVDGQVSRTEIQAGFAENLIQQGLAFAGIYVTEVETTKRQKEANEHIREMRSMDLQAEHAEEEPAEGAAETTEGEGQ